VGGLLALPVSDTLKREHDGHVLLTLSRQGLWAAQTPQMFRLGLLAAGAGARRGMQVTDEASAIEALGLRPLLVKGEWENLKVTWPADLQLAERLLGTR
jgi:2-C-methyl-D-erythritol 4-phosphate cytidylyltransferase